MKTLFDASAAAEIKERVASLTPASQRVWGRMDVAQMVAHCANAMEAAVGDVRPPRLFVGRLFGAMARKRVLSARPSPRNAPTSRELRIVDARDLDRERARLVQLIDRFVAGGPARCTTHPHQFFGSMNPEEWGKLTYKHLDHHLQQFSA